MWFVYYGLQIGLSREETENTKHGEMMDLISCHQIYNGTADPADKKLTFDEFIALR